MNIPPTPGFQLAPQPTTFLVNVIHPKTGRQDDALRMIEDIVRYVSGSPGFLWSSIAKSVDGLTVVNVEAIASEHEVDNFFNDSAFAAKFSELEKIARYEYHIYSVASIVLPKAAAGSIPAPDTESIR